MVGRFRRWYTAEFALLMLLGLLILQVIAVTQIVMVRRSLAEVRRNAAMIVLVRNTTEDNGRIVRVLQADADVRRDALFVIHARLGIIEERLAIRRRR